MEFPNEQARRSARQDDERLVWTVRSESFWLAGLQVGVCRGWIRDPGWAVLGPIFHFSDTWQLVINTGTTIVTFLMVFLIQNTQNRDARAINLKLNELIRSIDKARDQMIDIENLSDLELDELQAKYERIKTAYESREHQRKEKKKPSDVND